MDILCRTIYVFISVFLSLVSTSAFALNAEEVYKKNSLSIFPLYGIESSNNQLTSLGSAVAITNNILATNCHVASKGNYLVTKIGTAPKVAKLIYHNEAIDLCLVEVSEGQFIPVQIRDSKDVKIGEDVFAIGNPKGLEKTLSRGIISNRSIINGTALLQTDAAIAPGSSGGGLFDSEGRLIGITVGIIKNANNIGFAIPAELVSAALSVNEKIKSLALDSVINTRDPNKSVTRKITLQVKYYGTDKIALARSGQSCLIYFPGKDASGQIVSAATWQPGRPTLFTLYPNSNSIEKVFVTIFSIPKNKVVKLKTIQSYLILHKILYALKADSTLSGQYPFLIGKLSEDPTQTLVSDESFSAQLEATADAGQAGPKTIIFGLNGLNQALADYNTLCK